MKRILTSFLVLSSVAFTVDISNLGRCVDEVKQSMAQADSVMLFTSDYDSLMVQLKNPAVKTSFPDVYQMGFVDPFISYLEQMGRQQFDSVFRSGTDSFLSQIIPDMAEAVLQIGSMFAKKATDAFQEVISDLYEGFLSEESRVSNETMMPIKPPDRGVIPPLVKWGNPDFGPYTWPVDATSELHLKNAVVSLPPAHLKGGLLRGQLCLTKQAGMIFCMRIPACLKSWEIRLIKQSFPKRAIPFWQIIGGSVLMKLLPMFLGC